MSNQRTSRPKPPPPGNEEATATLNLGEFQNVDTLTLSEASLVLNALVAKRRNDRKNVNETECVFFSFLFVLAVLHEGLVQHWLCCSWGNVGAGKKITETKKKKKRVTPLPS